MIPFIFSLLVPLPPPLPRLSTRGREFSVTATRWTKANLFLALLAWLTLVCNLISTGNRISWFMGALAYGSCHLKTFKTSRASSYDFWFIVFSTKSLHRFVSIATSVLHSRTYLCIRRWPTRNEIFCWVYIVYVIESGAYRVVFTISLVWKPERARALWYK